MSNGITPVIAIILLLLITISMVGFAFVFFGRTTSASGAQIENETQQLVQQGTARFAIDTASGDKVYVRNLGSSPITGSALGVYVNGKQAGYALSSDIAPGAVGTLTITAPSCKDLLQGSAVKVTGGSYTDSFVASSSAPSGTYQINPGSQPVSAYCDMTTDGGGWTRVWIAPSANENIQTGGTSYIAGTAPVVANSNEILVAFTDASNALTQAWKMTAPSYWKSNHPFGVQCGSDTVTATRISDRTQVTDTLIYGTASFGSLCADACGGTWGRTCLRRAGFNGAYDFPFYATYSVTNPDHCSRSDESYATTGCSAGRLFVIYAR